MSCQPCKRRQLVSLMMCCKANHADVVVNEVRTELVFRFAVSFAVKRLRFLGEARLEAGSVTGRRRWDSNPRRLFTSHDFQSCSLDHYETPPGWGRREGDSNPRGLLTLPLFESGTFDHSDISPRSSITHLSTPDKHFFPFSRPSTLHIAKIGSSGRVHVTRRLCSLFLLGEEAKEGPHRCKAAPVQGSCAILS